jgi:hypothetical protein
MRRITGCIPGTWPGVISIIPDDRTLYCIEQFAFQHEIGVRFISILAQLVTLFFLWKLVEIKSLLQKKCFCFLESLHP